MPASSSRSSEIQDRGALDDISPADRGIFYLLEVAERVFILTKCMINFHRAVNCL